MHNRSHGSVCQRVGVGFGSDENDEDEEEEEVVEICVPDRGSTHNRKGEVDVRGKDATTRRLCGTDD